MGFVYVLRSGETDFFKVGRTESDVEGRVKQLSTGNPVPLVIFDVIETDYAARCETFLHNRLQARRSRESDAKEFFAIGATEMREEIAAARDYALNDLPKAAQVAALAVVECEDRWVEPSADAHRVFEELLQVRAAQAALQVERDRLENELKLVIGPTLGLEGLASWKVVPGHRFDAERFAQEHPEIYVTYYVETRQRTFRLL